MRRNLGALFSACAVDKLCAGSAKGWTGSSAARRAWLMSGRWLPLLWLQAGRAARRDWVEAALAAALHAHAGVAPADWRAYCRMAGLAADKFGLRLVPPALPPRALSLGALSRTQE